MTENTIPTADPRDLFPALADPAPLVVPSAYLHEFSSRELPALFPHEQLVMAAIARVTRPRVVLEFGTGQGFSSYLWAENTAADTRVITVDLDPSARSTYSAKILRDDTDVGRVLATARGIGKVEQILVDPNAGAPKALDGLAGRVDLAFIDGEHGYDGVRRDTEQAVALGHKDTVYLWHDFYRFPAYIAEGREKRGVFPYLNELTAAKRLELYHIAGTYLVVGRERWPHGVRSTVSQPGEAGTEMGGRIVRLAEF